MQNRRFTLLHACVFGFVLNLVVAVNAQSADGAPDPMDAQAHDRITRYINDDERAVLRGNVHPLARAEYDAGRVASNYRMDRMVLTLQPDSAQQAALEQLIDAQHNPDSPSYHQWLTPEQYAERFGASENDVAQVVTWLQSHGMQVEEVAAGRRSIVFSGNAGQVETAFRTPIHTYKIGEEVHHANAREPQIPLALAQVVGGVVSLHDFRPEAMHRRIGKPAPSFTAGSTHYLTPGDFATIYDVVPLYQQSINGNGQTIAIVGRSNINMSDVQSFRSNFGLPANNPQIVLNGSDPGTSNTGEETEAALDVEWSGAVAKNATVKFVVSASTNSSDGSFLSAQYIVNHNVAPVVSMSFGLCEAAFGSSGNSFINSLWQQAAAQGMTVFVSSGDSGAAGCDSSSASTGTHGRGVNALCSTPYSICVGGTQFNDNSNPTLYWATSNASGTQASAVSYIPENVWNESGGGSGLWASGGGVSTIYSKPSWQSGTGVPADGKRDVPDVALTASGHDGYLIYMNGGMYIVGGTSAASPSFAGLMALVVQNTNARQGNANTAFYSLATKQRSGGAVVFHDITSGSNSVPGVSGFSATAGYDPATGLGSVDANLMVNHWSDSTATPAFQVTPASSSVAVTAGSNASTGVTVAVSGGFSAAVKLAVTGLPSGVTGTFSPASLAAPGSGTSTLNLVTSATTKAGSYSATIAASSGSTSHTSTLSITVAPAPTFTLAATASISLPAGTSANATVTATPNSTFNSAIALSVTGLPTGMTAAFTPTSIGAPGSGTSTLRFTANSVVAPKAYVIAVTGSGGGVKISTTLTVNVPGFSISPSATTVTASGATKGTVKLTVTPVGGFSASMTFSVSGLPAGVTASFSPATITAPGSGSSTLTLTKGSTANAGTAQLSISATAGGITNSTSVKLTVNK